MAVDLFSEASPRYSFSHDINPASLMPAPSDTSPLDTGFEFEFGISESLVQESSSADELFSQGILLPIQIREKVVPTSKQPIDPNPAADQQELPIAEITSKATEVEEEKENAKEAAPSTCLEPEEKPQSKPSFWSFKRSSSLNCDGECKKSLLCSLQGLSRSNSTGSVPNPKKTLQNKDNATTASSSSPSKHPPLPKSSSTSSSSSSSLSSFYQYHQKPLNSKGYYGGSSYGSRGSRANSVLKVPPPYISNTNLFGLGSLFRNAKTKNPRNNSITP